MTMMVKHLVLMGHLWDDPNFLRKVGEDKTLNLHELAISMLAEDAGVFVMDIGGNFKHLCQDVGGEIIRLGKVIQPVSKRFTRCDKVMTVFELDDLTGDQSFMTQTLKNLLLLITIQFTSGKRRGQFVLIVSSSRVMMNLPTSFLESFEVSLKAAGGSLVFYDELGSNDKQ
jgi:hypothetical protein